MKKLCIVFAISFLCLGSRESLALPHNLDAFATLRADTITDTIMVKDMRCGQCETRIHRAIKKIAGIADSYAEAEKGTVIVTYDPAVISRDKIEEVIIKTGYGVGNRPGNPAARKALPSCCK